ncbi:ATP-binding protein [Hymenobacter persicinus]|uniref:ATP-binding protein n=1 Tax=Hymenobacter persicinus TaxID=2025506 RepID=A0A4V1ZAL1_9BACT|nr:ATP-binding protein [Hymenobacter persicinus]RYU78605.1 ATP-binding protein [Hymenobacter persicinus]
MKQVKIQVPSLVENIRVVESFIDNSKETFHIEDDIYGNIMVAVTEAVNNAIRHGNKFDKDKNVYLSLYVNKDRVKFEVEDEGDGFDYDNLLDPTAPENLENPGGRGIFLIRHLADEVEFNKDGRNVQLTFFLAPTTADEPSDTVSSETAA